MTDHLDSLRFQALLDGRLSFEEEQYLVRHLEDNRCERCDGFLASLSEDQEEQLQKLIWASEQVPDLPRTARQNVLEFGTPRFRFFRSSRSWAIGLATATLGAIAIGLTLWFFSNHPEGDSSRIKGNFEDPRNPVFLSVGILQESASSGSDLERQPQIQRLSQGQEVIAGSQLVFQIQSQGPCYMYLVRVGPDGTQRLFPEHLEKQYLHAGGAFSPSLSGNPAVLSTKQLVGIQRFVALCLKKPLEKSEQLDFMLKQIDPGTSERTRGVISYFIFPIMVSESGQTP